MGKEEKLVGVLLMQFRIFLIGVSEVTTCGHMEVGEGEFGVDGSKSRLIVGCLLL